MSRSRPGRAHRALRLIPKMLVLWLCLTLGLGPAAFAQTAPDQPAQTPKAESPAAPAPAVPAAPAPAPVAPSPHIEAAPQAQTSTPAQAPAPALAPVVQTSPAGQMPTAPSAPPSEAPKAEAPAQSQAPSVPQAAPVKASPAAPAPAQAAPQTSAPATAPAQSPASTVFGAPAAPLPPKAKAASAVKPSPAQSNDPCPPDQAPAQPQAQAPQPQRPAAQARPAAHAAPVVQNPVAKDAARLRQAAQGAPRVNVPLGKSLIQPTTAEISRVAVSNPEIADFVQVSPRQVYITGKAVGLTTMTLWDAEDRIRAIFDIEVTPDLSRLKKVMHDVLPTENTIEISAAQDRIALSGQIKNTENIGKAMALAEAFAPGKVLNLMQVGGVQQVMLEVRVAEMSRNLLKRMNINLNHIFQGDFVYTMLGGLTSQAAISNILNDEVQGTRGGARYPIRWNTQTPQYAISPSVNGMVNLNSPFGRSQGTWTAFVDLLKENGLIKILAEPTVVCLNGEKADFLAGGEIPVPIPQALGAITIEWKRFGVELGFRPTVLSGDRISLQVAPSVSDLDFSRAVQVGGSLVPALNKRAASTTVELGDGQSFAIAGLMREDARDSVSKYPALGDIPVLGALFKSQDYQKNQTELVIIITPHLAKPMDKSITKLPTDAMTSPSDADFYLNLRGVKDPDAPEPVKAPAQAPRTQSGPSSKASMDGEFGMAMPGARPGGSGRTQE